MAKVADQYLLLIPGKSSRRDFTPIEAKCQNRCFRWRMNIRACAVFSMKAIRAKSLIGVYLNGIYEERFTEGMSYKGISNRLALWSIRSTGCIPASKLDGETLDLAKSKFSDFRRELDFRTGELRREFVWETRSGKKLRLVFLRLLSMETKELACQQIRMTPLNFSGRVIIDAGTGLFHTASYVRIRTFGIVHASERRRRSWG